jgi:hypothetical protein
VVTSLLVIVAGLAVAGGVVAVAAPNPRHATLGAFAAMLLVGLVADPLPSAAGLVARLAGGALGGWLVWMALRTAPAAASRAALGWAGSAGVALAAFAIGWLSATTLAGALAASGASAGDIAGQTLAGGSLVDRAAIGAAAALAVLAAAPVIVPRDGHRLGLGVLLLLAAGGLLCAALSIAPDDTLELALALLTALTGAAVAAVTAAMLGAGGDLVLRDALAREPAVRHRAADDAHLGNARPGVPE